jgi:WD40 repeat protein
MPMVIDPISEIECEAIVRAIDVSPDGKWIAWGSDDGVIRIIDTSGKPTALEPFNVDDAVTHLQIANGGVIVVGTHTSDLYGHERLGGHRWTHAIGGGCDHLHQSGDGSIIGCIDGGRHLHLMTENGINRGRFTAGELIGISVANDGTGVAVSDDEGNVHVLDTNGNKRWSRVPESESGETISAMCFLHDGSLLLCREVLGITPSDIAQIALERWSSTGQRMFSEEINSRSMCIIPDGLGALSGQFDGTVLKINDDLTSATIWKSMYTINDLRRQGNDVLVASWFYLHRIDAVGEEVWRCEHSGLVQSIIASQDGSRIALSGDNQNDYTRENRILWIDPDATPYALSSDMDIDDDLLEFVEGAELKAPLAAPDEDIYANDGQDIASLLTEEEQKQFNSRDSTVDDSELFAMLDDEIEQMAQFQEEDTDLMAGLSDQEFVSHVSPTADAGMDVIINANQDGTAIVLLDGSATSPGSQGIEQWVWRDGHSKQIGDTEKINVRLPIGNHTFTLTVSDPARESSTDTITVQVLGENREDTYDLLED